MQSLPREGGGGGCAKKVGNPCSKQMMDLRQLMFLDLYSAHTTVSWMRLLFVD